jgi:hypothetical protein
VVSGATYPGNIYKISYGGFDTKPAGHLGTVFLQADADNIETNDGAYFTCEVNPADYAYIGLVVEYTYDTEPANATCHMRPRFLLAPTGQPVYLDCWNYSGTPAYENVASNAVASSLEEFVIQGAKAGGDYNSGSAPYKTKFLLYKATS